MLLYLNSILNKRLILIAPWESTWQEGMMQMQRPLHGATETKSNELNFRFNRNSFNKISNNGTFELNFGCERQIR